ncbi:MAG: hypothetical protein EOO06_00850 [Chitinophagaceae bacterium]|nr:MAG: hypothetical protein EOO06_00850 [Chitinophagaceae bacterium]
MLCVTLLTLAFVSPSNVYSEESYIVDTASNPHTQSVDCAVNTADVKLESGFYWEASDKEFTKYLARYNIKADLATLDSMNVTQEMLSEDMIP